MADEVPGCISVSRRIDAPADVIFEVLANPKRHVDIDGSGSVRTGTDSPVITAVGDIFIMKMYFDHLGDYETNNLVVAFEPDRLIAWETAAGRGHPRGNADGSVANRLGHRWGYELVADGPGATIVTETYDCRATPEAFQAEMDYGKMWVESMETTLERLEQLCVG